MLEKLPDKVKLYLAVFISLNRSHSVHYFLSVSTQDSICGIPSQQLPLMQFITELLKMPSSASFSTSSLPHLLEGEKYPRVL